MTHALKPVRCARLPRFFRTNRPPLASRQQEPAPDSQYITACHAKSLAALNIVAATVSQSLDLEKTLNVALDLALAVIGVEAGGISLVDKKAGELVMRVHRGWRQPDLGNSMRIKLGTGLSGLVTTSGQVLVTGDVRDDPRLAVPAFGREGVKAMAMAPMRAHGAVVGVLSAMSYQPYTFSPEDIKLLTAIADLIGVAIDNARLYENTRLRLNELAALSQVSLAGASTLDPDQVLERMLQAIRSTLNFETFEFILLNPVNHTLDLAVGYGTLQTRERTIHIGEGVTGWVAEHGQSALVSDVSQDPRYIEATPGTRSELAVPLKAGGQTIGVINVESPQINRFTSDDQRLLETLAGQMVIIIQNARLHAETQRRLAHVSTLYTFARQLSTSLDMNVVLDSIVSLLKQVLECSAVNIWFLDPQTQRPAIRASSTMPGAGEGEPSQVSTVVASEVIATAQPRHVPNTLALAPPCFDEAARALVCVPLIAREHVIGALSVEARSPNAFTPDDELLLTIVAAQASVAIENARLFEDVTERARKLEQAYLDLQEVNRRRDELVQNMSHELRTPLTFIKGYLELLLEGTLGAFNERQRESLDVIEDKTEAIARLVNDIILFQQIERQSLNLDALDLEQIARQATHNLKTATEAHHLALSVDVPGGLAPVLADPTQIYHVFYHLLNNAAKFSPDGGHITIQITSNGNNVIQTAIHDTGIGIPQHLLGKIFEPFYQVDGSSTRHYGGTGLGLAIVKRIVEAHNGRVWAESQPGRGSSFYFTLPKACLK